MARDPYVLPCPLRSYSQLLELRDELTFLKLLLSEAISEFGLRHRRCRSIRKRIFRLKLAIRAHSQLSSWRTEDVFVVARSRQEARTLVKHIGWPTRQQAVSHLQIVRVLKGSNWVHALPYRVFKLKRFQRIDRDEFVTELIEASKKGNYLLDRLAP